MSNKRQKVQGDGDWLKQLDSLVSKTKQLSEPSSFPEELVKMGPKAPPWRPFSFKIQEVISKSTIAIVESGVGGARPVRVRLGTQPVEFMERTVTDGVTLHCTEYAVSELQGKSQLLLWKISRE